MTNMELEQTINFWNNQEIKPVENLYEWIDEFLKSHKVIVLATGAKDFVRCTPLEYSWHHDAIWIFSEGGMKFRGIQENKQVSASVFENSTEFGKLKSMQIDGTVELVELFSEEYIQAANIRKLPVEALKKMPYPMWLLKITPKEITCLNSDFKKAGYTSRQIWKAQ